LSVPANNFVVRLSFIDLFGAPGGMSLGFKMAGMKPLAALDNFKDGMETYRKNFGLKDNAMCFDVNTNGTVKEFRDKTKLRKGDIDVIIGGPPCQGFSIMGRIKIASLVKNGQRKGHSADPRFIDDERNRLYKAFIKFVDYYKPKGVVMENVLGMRSYRNGSVTRQIIQDFNRVGYANADYSILNAADYGTPQIRKRIFFIATRKNIAIRWPKNTHFKKSQFDRSLLDPNLHEHVTVGDAIGDLPHMRPPAKNLKLKDFVKPYGKDPSCEYQRWARNKLVEVHNNITRWHRKKDLEVFQNMPPGSRWSELSARDRKKIGYSDKSFIDKWKRLSNNKPSWTVTSHLHKDGYMYIHPTQNRTITVREAARLQSFPDHFVFEGSRSSQFKQVGNAVPPLMAYAVAKSVKKMLSV